MDGLIFAAGLGTRLAPLTNTQPKALVNLNGRPMLEHAIENFVRCGARRIAVNVHHFATMVERYIRDNAARWPNVEFYISDESRLLLDTGGGLVKAAELLDGDEPIVVGNADVYSNAPLDQLLDFHLRSGRMATLLTRTRNSTRQLLFDADGRLSGWVNKTTGETRLPRPVDNLSEAAFCGFHVVERQLIRAMGEVRPFPIIGAYLDCAAQYNIGRMNLDKQYYWFDVGTVEKLAAAEQFARQQNDR